MATDNQQRVVVTAAGDGIGRRIAEVFLEAGAQVHACDVVAERLAELEEKHPTVSTSVTDVANDTAVANMFRDVERAFDGLDVLVNTAGTAGPVDLIEDMDPAEWRRCLEINLSGAFLCSRSAIPLLKRRPTGSIINFTSSSIEHPGTHRAPYLSSKFGIIGLTRVLAAELGPHQIRVNAIAPGATEGARIDRVIELEAAALGQNVESVRREAELEAAMQTFVTADDLAQMVFFLCSDRARRVSGQTIAVDGCTL